MADDLCVGGCGGGDDDGVSFDALLLLPLSTSLLYNKTIGTIAGNIIAAIPTVQLTVNSEIAMGS